MRKWISKATIMLFISSLTNVTIAITTSQQRWHISDLFHSNNLWTEISSHFGIYKKYVDNYYVQKKIRWFRQQQYYLSELTQNARPYIYYVLQETKKRGMPAEIALLPMIESNYNSFSYSRRGATGLWQFMPGTAASFGLLINWWYDERRDVIASTNAALNYLQYLHECFHSWLLAIAAYDAGKSAVAAAIRYNLRLGRPTDFWSLPLPYETREYIPKLLALADIIKNHTLYGLRLQSVENHPYFTMVILKTPTNFNQLVKLSGSSLKSLRLLNPGFRRLTIPNHTYSLLIPTNKVAQLQENLATLSKHLRSYHRVHPGDSLSTLANHYHTSIQEIRKMNKLKGDIIRVGENLLIP